MSSTTVGGRNLGSDSAAGARSAQDPMKSAEKPSPSPADGPPPMMVPSGFWYELPFARPFVSKPFRDSLKREIWSLMIEQDLRLVVSYINDKSGSKTVNALHFASMVAETTGLTVLLVPATLNTSTGTPHLMSAATGNGKTVSELSSMVERGEITDHQTLSQNVYHMPAPYNVWVVAEDIHTGLKRKHEYTEVHFERMVRKLYPMVDVIVFDHGNDDLTEDSIGLAALRMSSTVVLPALRGTWYSMESAKRTFLNYRSDTYQGLTAERVAELQQGGQAILPGEWVSTREKLRRTTLVMSGVNNYRREQFEELIAPTDKPQHLNLKDESFVWKGAGLPVPPDSYIKRDRWICDLNKLGGRTYDAVLAQTVAVLRDGLITHMVAARNMRRPAKSPAKETTGSDFLSPPASSRDGAPSPDQAHTSA